MRCWSHNFILFQPGPKRQRSPHHLFQQQPARLLQAKNLRDFWKDRWSHFYQKEQKIWVMWGHHGFFHAISTRMVGSFPLHEPQFFLGGLLSHTIFLGAPHHCSEKFDSCLMFLFCITSFVKLHVHIVSHNDIGWNCGFGRKSKPFRFQLYTPEN